jgi:glycosyltransferase involved in cell wall biosynthesis
MMKNNISFIIPAYNCEKTIEESVNSILETNFELGDEIIIVNDCSNDKTKNILRKIYENNPKIIKIIDHEKNMGGGAARNTAIKNSKNEIIFCLDSDNLLEENSIGFLKKSFLDNKNFSAAAFKLVKYFKKNLQITHVTEYIDNFVNFQDILSGHTNPASSGNYLFTKKSWEISGGYSENSGALDSWSLGVRQSAIVGPILTVSGFGYFHRYGHKSYWIRENKGILLSKKAEDILKPFFDRIKEEDVEYIEKNSNWFEKLAERPIRLKNDLTGLDGREISKKETMLGRIYCIIKKYLKNEKSY